MVPTRQRPYPTLFAQQGHFDLISFRDGNTRLNRRVYILLRLVHENIFAHNLYEVVSGAEPTIRLLNEASKDVGNVMVHLVPIPQLFTLAN